jgi:Serine/threonine protein phosphatase
METSFQGQREHMEDRYDTFENERFAYFGVYDGHGGSSVSDYLKSKARNKLLNALRYSDPVSSLRNAVFELDNECIRELGSLAKHTGSTLNALIVDKQINVLYLINVGDSRSVVYDDSFQVMIETSDHTPRDPREYKRVGCGGGYITHKRTLRVNGNLMMSRAIGDAYLKEPLRPRSLEFCTEFTPRSIAGPVIGIADVYKFEMRQGKNYVVLGTDGLWDIIGTGRNLGHLLVQQLPMRNVAKIMQEEFSEQGLERKGQRAHDNTTWILVEIENTKNMRI